MYEVMLPNLASLCQILAAKSIGNDTITKDQGSTSMLDYLPFLHLQSNCVGTKNSEIQSP